MTNKRTRQEFWIIFGVNLAMPYVSHGCLKSTQKWSFKRKGITSLIEGDIFLASISTRLFSVLFYFFCIFVFFVCLGGFPLNMVVVAVCCGLFLMDFKSRLKSKRKLQKKLLMMFCGVEFCPWWQKGTCFQSIWFPQFPCVRFRFQVGPV